MTDVPGCIVFDFDGTLVSCKQRQIAVLRATLAACGLASIDCQTHWNLKRQGATTVAALIAQGLADDLAAYVGSLWREEVERWPWLSLDTPLAGAVGLLAELVARRFRLILLSARSNPALLRLQLRQLSLFDAFSDVITVNPSVAIDRKASVLMQVRPALYIGDTEADARAASLAGTRFLAVASGQRSPGYLVAQRISPVLPDLPAAANVIFSLAEEIHH